MACNQNVFKVAIILFSIWEGKAEVHWAKDVLFKIENDKILVFVGHSTFPQTSDVGLDIVRTLDIGSILRWKGKVNLLTFCYIQWFSIVFKKCMEVHSKLYSKQMILATF